MKTDVTQKDYCATIVQVTSLVPLAGCDNVQGFPIHGHQAIVSINTKVGDVWVLFTAETQLSHEYVMTNNLYRHQELNSDILQKGYIEDNRRVKAMKFRGHKYSAFFMPLESLSYLGVNPEEFAIGDTFNSINGIGVCIKYLVKKDGDRGNNVRWKTKKFKRIDNKTFPGHLDSDNYFKNTHMFNDTDEITITQKLHGTSGRFGYVKVRRQLNWFENLLKRLGIKINEVEYDYIAGSRRVIKDMKSSSQFGHYYNSDLWNQTLDSIKDQLPKDYILYGEIIGWVDGNTPIQRGYTYKVPAWTNELYIYRISIVNEDGIAIDLSFDQIVQFCNNVWLKHVPILGKMIHRNFKVDEYMDIKYHTAMDARALPLDNNSPCDEGIVVRKEGLAPYLAKAKCPLFYEHETKMMDAWVEDVESE